MSRLLPALLAILLLGGCATARRWGGLAAHDAAEAVRAPLRAEPKTWAKAGALASAVVAAKLLDDEAAGALQSESGRADRIAERVEPFGGRYSDRVLAGFLAAGLLRDDSRAKEVAFDGLVSSILASKIVTPAIKEISGRRRPHTDGDDSFPSNHATQAFAVASVIASHYEQRWVDVTAYALATAVGASRIRHDDHFFSDVVAGAIIGAGVGRFVTRTNETARARWSVEPVATREGPGVVVRVGW